MLVLYFGCKHKDLPKINKLNLYFFERENNKLQRELCINKNFKLFMSFFEEEKNRFFTQSGFGIKNFDGCLKGFKIIEFST